MKGLAKHCLYVNQYKICKFVALLVLLYAGSCYNKEDLARDPSTSKEILANLAEYPDWKIRIKVAVNPNTPPYILSKFANEGVDMRRAVASNHSTPKETLIKLTEDNNWSVRHNAAMNPNTPAEALIKLANDTQCWIGLAVNPQSPPEVLKEIGTKGDEGVRCMVARNPNATEDILIKLSKDQDLVVSCAAIETLEKRKEK